MKMQLKNVTVELCYGAENAALGGFFRFMEKRHGTKRHINALLAAGIDTTDALEAKLDDIGLLRGLGEKSAKEVIDGYMDYRESIMSPEEKKKREIQKWNLTTAAGETPYEVGEKVFFFEKHQHDTVPVLRCGVVRCVRMTFGYENSERRDHGAKALHFEVHVWHAEANALIRFEPKSLFRTKKEAIAAIEVAQ